MTSSSPRSIPQLSRTMTTPPRYLFRCWSDQSNGTNKPTHFAPASLSPEHNADFIPLGDVDHDIGQQLRQALLWKKDQPRCPLVHFTTSPLFAVQLAVWRSKRQTFRDGSVAEPDTAINITIVDTETTTTTKGEKVQYQRVKDLLHTYNVDLRNRSDNSRRWYEDVWVATTEVQLGKECFYAEFDDIVRNGLFELYPAVEAANERRDPRLELAVQDLRGYLFDESEGGGGESEQSGRLTKEGDLDAAARVALTFQSCVGDDECGESIGVRLSFALALRKRAIESTTLRDWVQDHIEDPSSDMDGSESLSEAYDLPGFPDAKQLDVLRQRFSGMVFDHGSLLIGSFIDPRSIEEEKAHWARWWNNSRDAYRASHPREQRQRRDRRVRQTDRASELIERRARRVSVVQQQADHYAGRERISEPQELLDEPDGADSRLRELFPGWERHSARRQTYRRSGDHHRDLRRREGGYQVISSRPGDFQTTQQQTEMERERAGRPKDRDGGWAKRRPWKTGKKGEMRY